MRGPSNRENGGEEPRPAPRRTRILLHEQEQDRHEKGENAETFGERRGR